MKYKNLKRSLAKISRQVVGKYFYNLGQNLNKIPPTINIVNYDKMNLTDDPGRKKMVTKQRTKYQERIMDTSKLQVLKYLLQPVIRPFFHTKIFYHVLLKDSCLTQKPFTLVTSQLSA